VTGPATLDDWSQFHQAIDNLPESERDVVLLKWFMNATDETIAAMLGVSESTTQRLWRDAKKRINDEMGGERPR
jgi:RNA polymerase sigma-70 factor (ECF subfamily)